ncbi:MULTISPECIES: SDR family oxidoreductase [Bradyrhizobium]|uniref:SDR family oxidoreductase n=1 Tax=Bradyrhizobium TaxID=374 RepID=UPI000F52CC67|nr:MULTISPECIES: SDR family oxidoreductase [Bradyrhizobium]RQH05875.1 SDR family oxidoreductase [Bradyrhizobium sp. RP6]UWU93445.1 SDR family oxidoreductase [Bradyrhizobium sp. CB1015]
MTQGSKTVIVTGGLQGIGLSAVRTFIERGYNVVATSRRVTRSLLSELGPGGWGRRHASTATRVAETAVGKFSSIDALVNNAEIFVVNPFTDYPGDDLKQLLSTNLNGFIYMTQVAIRQIQIMAQTSGGSIVSITAALAGKPDWDFLRRPSPMGSISSIQEIVIEARRITREILRVDGGAHVGKW